MFEFVCVCLATQFEEYKTEEKKKFATLADNERQFRIFKMCAPACTLAPHPNRARRRVVALVFVTHPDSNPDTHTVMQAFLVRWSRAKAERKRERR